MGTMVLVYMILVATIIRAQNPPAWPNMSDRKVLYIQEEEPNIGLVQPILFYNPTQEAVDLAMLAEDVTAVVFTNPVICEGNPPKGVLVFNCKPTCTKKNLTGEAMDTSSSEVNSTPAPAK